MLHFRQSSHFLHYRNGPITFYANFIFFLSYIQSKLSVYKRNFNTLHVLISMFYAQGCTCVFEHACMWAASSPKYACTVGCASILSASFATFSGSIKMISERFMDGTRALFRCHKHFSTFLFVSILGQTDLQSKFNMKPAVMYQSGSGSNLY